jgi:hypothetical protein
MKPAINYKFLLVACLPGKVSESCQTLNHYAWYTPSGTIFSPFQYLPVIHNNVDK